MRAAVLSGPSQAVEVRDVDLAEPKAGEVLVSRRIGLKDLNEAFDRLRAGTEARQVVVFDGSEVAAG
jgi:Zn-dependent alcohol dehydrogenase